MKHWGHNQHKITLAPFVSQADYTTDQERLTPAQWLRRLRFRACPDANAEDTQRRMDARAEDVIAATADMARMDQTGTTEYPWQCVEEERRRCELVIRRAVILERHLPRLRAIVSERLERQARVNTLRREMMEYYQGLIKTRAGRKPPKSDPAAVEQRIAAYQRACGKRMQLSERTEGAFLVLVHARGWAKFKVVI